MSSYTRPARFQRVLEKMKRLLKRNPEPELPGDPYAMVGAPKKPRPPHRSSAAAEPLD